MIHYYLHYGLQDNELHALILEMYHSLKVVVYMIYISICSTFSKHVSNSLNMASLIIPPPPLVKGNGTTNQSTNAYHASRKIPQSPPLYRQTGTGPAIRLGGGKLLRVTKYKHEY